MPRGRPSEEDGAATPDDDASSQSVGERRGGSTAVEGGGDVTPESQAADEAGAKTRAAAVQVPPFHVVCSVYEARRSKSGTPANK